MQITNYGDSAFKYNSGELSTLSPHPVTEERVRRILSQHPEAAPLPDHLVGEHHGFPTGWPQDFTALIRWLMRWWR